MKYASLLFAVLMTIMSSCSKKNNVGPLQNTTRAIYKDGGPIQFKAIPLADNQLKVEFIKTTVPSGKVILKQDTAKIAEVSVSDDSYGYASATFNYAFKSGVKYNFVIQAPITGTDTIKQYSIQNYVHRYVKKYNYTQVLAIKQSMGPQGFDLSPSRQRLFVQDDINNVVQTKMIDLQTLAVTNLGADFAGSPIRAVSDNELLAYGNKFTANVPSPADPGNDAVVLAKYNISTQQSTFVSFVSEGYGRISRIINNHVLVTNPIFTAKTASLINLDKLSAVTYSLDNFNFTVINENSFGHLIHGNDLVNPADGSVSTPVQIGANSGLIEIDDATGYAFVGTSVTDAQKNISTGFNVYKNNKLVYQSDFKFGRSDYFPIIYDIDNNIVTFYRHFDFDTVVNLDGYYTLDIATGEIKLIQTDSNPYVISDYQQKDGAVFSVRSDGVYKLTITN